MIPEYHPPHTWPEAEPHKAGNDSSDTTRTLLATADEIIAAKTDEVRVLDDALGEAFSVIRELRAQIDAQSEQIATLREFAGERVERQTEELRRAS